MEAKYDNIVWVIGLPQRVTEAEIRDYFSKCGNIVNIMVYSSKYRMSYCFIEFEDPLGVQSAITYNKSIFNKEVDPKKYLIVALTDKARYDIHVKKNESRAKLNAQIEKTIENKTKFESYLYGFNEGRKYRTAYNKQQH